MFRTSTYKCLKSIRIHAPAPQAGWWVLAGRQRCPCVRTRCRRCSATIATESSNESWATAAMRRAAGWWLRQGRLYAEIRGASLKCCCLRGITTAVILMATGAVESKIPHPNVLCLASFMYCDHCMGKLLDVCSTRHFQWGRAGVPFINSTVLINRKAYRYVLVCLSFESGSPFYFNPT